MPQASYFANESPTAVVTTINDDTVTTAVVDLFSTDVVALVLPELNSTSVTFQHCQDISGAGAVPIMDTLGNEGDAYSLVINGAGKYPVNATFFAGTRFLQMTFGTAETIGTEITVVPWLV